jgi:N-acyl-phosphatidylethanolamine-hydrolysing phospholipase D
VFELDWGGQETVAGTAIHCVPALHFSGRGLFDRNRTLWCGYVIELRDRRVYFAGDTAFGDHFAAIRERFGPPSLALLPIGAYAPRWFMSPIHMDPGEAMRAHEILESGMSVATHHSTFQLADDGIDTAARRLAESPNRPESFLILRNGQSTELA